MVYFSFVDEQAKHGDKDAQNLLWPKRASKEASGFDLVASCSQTIIVPGARSLISTGIALCLQKGTEAQIRPRSGLALRHGITCLNSPGTIDSDYRGEIKVLLINFGEEPFVIERGMRIAQLVLAPVLMDDFAWQSELSDSIRGNNGFGSTGLL